MFIKELEPYIKGLKYKKDKIGRSGDAVYLFENKYVLKISKNKEKLLNEKIKNDWISLYIKSPKTVIFIEKYDKVYYLREMINGDSLIAQKYINNPYVLIKTLKNVIKILRSLDDKGCPFKSASTNGNSFIHGDLCLPNIYVDNNGDFIGFIDLEDAGLGDSFYDYSWLIWSFEYNLKTNEYREELIKELDIDFDLNKFIEYTK